MEHEAAFPAELASAAVARRYAETVLVAWHCDALVESAQLLISELVVNAVMHARSTVRVRLSMRRGAVRVEVADSHPDLPRLRPLDTTAVDGRGLLIVDAVASSWGVDATDDGKVVWFELDSDDADPVRAS